MSDARPEFMDSPYYYFDNSGGHLKDGAPAEIVRAFEEWYYEDNTAEQWSPIPEPIAKALTLDDLNNSDG